MLKFTVGWVTYTDRSLAQPITFSYLNSVLSYSWIRKGGKNAAPTRVKEPDPDPSSFDLLDPDPDRIPNTDPDPDPGVKHTL